MTVVLLNDPSFEARMSYMRSSGRLNSRVAVGIEWTNAGRKLSAEGFAVGQKVRLVNLINQISCEAVLLWRGREGRTGWELGLELQDPSPDFWGLDF
jgi:hypothetical protein